MTSTLNIEIIKLASMKISLKKNQTSNLVEFTNVPAEFLALAAKSSQAFQIRCFVWLILKNETPSGKIKDYKKQFHELAGNHGVPVNTFNKYIPKLQEDGFLLIEGKDLLLKGYSTLKKYGINIKHRENITISACRNSVAALIAYSHSKTTH
jgi:hypothetical protein